MTLLCPTCFHPKPAHKYKADGETFHCETCTAEGKSCLKVETDNSEDRMWRGDTRYRMRQAEKER